MKDISGYYKKKVTNILIQHAKEGYCLVSINRVSASVPAIVLVFSKFGWGTRRKRIASQEVSDHYIISQWEKIKGGNWSV